MQNLDLKVELWKKRLLDLGKRNRLINFKETKRSNIAIKSPSIGDLFNLLVHEEKSLKFSSPSKTIFDEKGEEQSLLIVNGDIETNLTLNEQQRTLKSLRAKAKTSTEEQGINTLYLTLGMLNWKENVNSGDLISSPIILVPVRLKIEAINEPYILSLHDDEAVLNPNLAYKLENDYGIVFPEFNEHEDNITEYISKIEKITNINGWSITNETYLALLSFLKMNMYKDLEKNKDRIVSNSIIKALAGDYSEVIQVPTNLNNFDHDRNTRPIETLQVVDADSSQQDAILLSKKGISFVLQGPPGTGKSQTITNIISDAIYDGKKVLFVSEKMAALDVVKNRIAEVKLDDFCLTLHSHNANKKDILGQLEKTLNMPKVKVHEDVLYKLSELEEIRKKLNKYHEELHTKCMKLNTSIYEINGKLAKLDETEDIVFSIEDVENTDIDKLNKYKYLINEYAKSIGKKSMDYSENPWYDSNFTILTHEYRHNIDVILTRLLPRFENFIEIYEEIIKLTGAKFNYSIENVKVLSEILNLSIKSSLIPRDWLNFDIDELIGIANGFTFKFKQYFDLKSQL
jgi:DNA replication protein DnaC